MSTLQYLPEKLFPLHATIVLEVSEPLGPTADVFLHERARVLPQYHEPVRCVADGVDATGKKIAVNTIGRWLFGVPGFQGHVRIVPEHTTVTIYYPEQAPQAAHSLLTALKDAVEGALH